MDDKLRAIIRATGEIPSFLGDVAQSIASLIKPRETKLLSPIPEAKPTPTPDPFIEKGWIKTGENKYISLAALQARREVEGIQNKPVPISKVTSNNPFEKVINNIFGERANEAKRVLSYKDEKGEIHGENTSFQTGPEVDIPNADGSIDRGLFRINSYTFADFMNRKKELLNRNGIYLYEDMYDPEKNTKMAKIIFDEQGWDAWYASPPDLKEKQ